MSLLRSSLGSLLLRRHPTAATSWAGPVGAVGERRIHTATPSDRARPFSLSHCRQHASFAGALFAAPTRTALFFGRHALARPRCFATTGDTSLDADTNTISTLYKRFLLLVHPDKYHQWPEHQSLNLKALQQLNSYMNVKATDPRAQISYPVHFVVRKTPEEVEALKFNLTLPSFTADGAASIVLWKRLKNHSLAQLFAVAGIDVPEHLRLPPTKTASPKKQVEEVTEYMDRHFRTSEEMFNDFQKMETDFQESYVDVDIRKSKEITTAQLRMGEERVLHILSTNEKDSKYHEWRGIPIVLHTSFSIKSHPGCFAIPWNVTTQSFINFIRLNLRAVKRRVRRDRGKDKPFKP